MTAPTRILAQEEHGLVAGIVVEARAALLAAGYPARGPRFPFAMHHALLRRRLRGGFEGRKALRHAEVSILLVEWATSRGDPSDYAWQAIAAAIESMESETPALVGKTPENIRREIARHNDTFRDFAQERIDRERTRRRRAVAEKTAS